MPTYPGLYRAKAVQRTGDVVTVFIPQIFGTTEVTVSEFVGTLPAATEMGWVAFQNGAPEYPVWLGGPATDRVLLAAYWVYNASITAPPASGEVRTNTGTTTMWLSKTDSGGFARPAVSTIVVNEVIQARAADGSVASLRVTGAPVDNGTYVTLPVVILSGTMDPKKGTTIELSLIRQV